MATGEDPIELAAGLMRQALLHLDAAGRSLAAARLQHALDTLGHDEPVPLSEASV